MVRIRTHRTKSKPTDVRLAALTMEENTVFKFWNKYFGVIFSLYLAENHVWPPHLYEPTNKKVTELLNIRVDQLAYLERTGYTRQDAIKLLDTESWKNIAELRMRGYDIEEDNIFYAYSP